MHFEKFIDQVSAYWRDYLSALNRAAGRGLLNFPSGHTLLFPNMILFTNCSGYYTCELFGLSRQYKGLTVKRHVEASVYRYLSQLYDDEPDPIFAVDRGLSLSGFTLSTAGSLDKVAMRFPCVEVQKTTLTRTNGRGSVVGFGENLEYCVFESCVLVNVREELYRCKNILNLIVFNNNVSAGYLRGFFSSYFREKNLHGMCCVSDEHVQRKIAAGQLQSLYFLRGLRETTLGEFFNLNPEIICRAFDAEAFIYEPYLKWVEHDGTCEDVAINPDLILRRRDGLCDIYDLKTALIEKAKITRGERRRRKFIEYVEDGVAQLANYREYFSYSLNADFARDKYGIEVSNPGLVLVVGNWDNSNKDEVAQACRRYPDIRVIDYDTLCHLFLGGVSKVGECEVVVKE